MRKRRPDRAEDCITVPEETGCPPTVSWPQPASGRSPRVIAAKVSLPPPERAKSSAVKAMTSPSRPFLEKSMTPGASDFRLQKKAEEGRDMAPSSMSASRSVSPLRAV